MRKVIALLLLFPLFAVAGNPIGRGYFEKASSGRYTPAIQAGALGVLPWVQAGEAAWSTNGTNVQVAGSFDTAVTEGQQGVLVRVFLELPVPGTADLCSGVVNVASVLSESGVVYGSPQGDGLLIYNPPLGTNTVAVDFAPRATGRRTYQYQYTCDVK